MPDSVNVVELGLDETKSTTINTIFEVGGSYNFFPTQIDFQEHGVMFDVVYTGNSTQRFFVPYAQLNYVNQVLSIP